jgi:hypothetical protein
MKGRKMPSEKKLSKTGSTGALGLIGGLLALLAPKFGFLEGMTEQDLVDLVQIVGGAWASISALVIWFRKISDGRKPKVI